MSQETEFNPLKFDPPINGTITLSISQERWYGLMSQSPIVLDLIDADPKNGSAIFRKMAYLAFDMLMFLQPSGEGKEMDEYREMIRYVCNERAKID